MLYYASGGPIFSALPEKMGGEKGRLGRGSCILHLCSGDNQIC